MQTRITDQPAFLLHRRDWQNTSLILNFFTFDYGRVNVLAKGGRSGKSVGLLQPFHKLSISWTGRQDLKTLIAVDGERIPVEESLYLPLLYINELLLAFLPQHEPGPKIFSIYADLLKEINLSNIERCLRYFECLTMQQLGYMPELHVDASSGIPIQASEFYIFQVTEGFQICRDYTPNAISGAHIIAWNELQLEDSQVLKIAKSVMRSIIDFNLQGKRLKSRDIYLQINKRK